MRHHRRLLSRVLGPALLLAAGLALSSRGADAAYPRGADAAYPDIAHVDGYLAANGGCLMLRQHDGRLLAVAGDARGLLPGDHVRLEGRFVPDPGCGAAGFEVGMVQTIWGDDNHRTARYDHLGGEPFLRFAERTGRLGESRRYELERRAYQNDRREYERQRLNYEDQRRGYEGGASVEERSGGDGRDERYEQHPDRADRRGHYVYAGPHRRVTLVGKIHEPASTCATLETEHAVFALDGNLGEYQAGDQVRVSGVLYDADPNAPCGRPTVVVTGIRGQR